MKPDYRQTIRASYLGSITQAVTNNLAPLLFLIFRDELGIPLAQITLLVTVNFLVQLLVDLLSAKFVDRIGYRACIVGAHAFSAMGLVGLALLPGILPSPFAGLMIAVVLYAIGGGIIEVLVSPIVEACPTENKASAMSLLHSFYCWGTVLVILVTTLLLSVFGKNAWRTVACGWAALPIANAFLFARAPIARLTAGGEGMSLKALFSLKTFWLFLILMMTSGASEQAMSQWASAFAESGLRVPKAVGDIAGPCFFSVLMGCARLFYAKRGQRMNLISFIIGSGALCVCSYLLAAFSPNPILALLGCGLCGLSVGVLWPGVCSVAAASYPKGGTAMFALLALAGDLGCSGGPTLVGLVAGMLGDNLKAGLAVATVFPIGLLICAWAYRRGSQKAYR